MQSESIVKAMAEAKGWRATEEGHFLVVGRGMQVPDRLMHLHGA